MKKLLFLLVLGIGGYFAYFYFFTTIPEAPPPPLPDSTSISIPARAPTPKRLPLSARRHIKNLFEHWRKSQLTPHIPDAKTIVPGRELAELRRKLFSEGMYSEGALEEAIFSELVNLGVAPGEASGIASSICALQTQETGIPQHQR